MRRRERVVMVREGGNGGWGGGVMGRKRGDEKEREA